MGRPTNVLPDGSSIETLQRLPVSSRHYRGNLGNPGGKHTAVLPPPRALSRAAAPGNRTSVRRSSSARQPPAITAPEEEEKKGVEAMRTKRHLRETVVKGTPQSKVASYQILDDIAHERNNAATETVFDAENDDRQECSQAVASTAILLKKMENDSKTNS